ncbi:MAG TPA: hypothetical protein PKL85_03460 [Bacteroidia bacterium]|nr:hypothetical protein [Bacteroidia bacterium]
MKKTYSIKFLAGISFLLVVVFSGCKKDEDDDQTPVSTTGSLMFHLHTMADTNEVESYGDTLVMSDGRQIAVSTAQLYISNIKLIKTDGSVVDGPSGTIIMKQGEEEYDLGTAPVGNYKSVRFDVGLSDASNASTPASSDQVLYQPSMWFGASAQPDGFVFINFAGSIDTTAAANGTDLIPFTYKIGTVSNRVTITMPDENYSISPDQQSAIHMTVDYAKLFTGIQLNNAGNLNLTTAAQNSGSLAAQLKSNISDLFDYE